MKLYCNRCQQDEDVLLSSHLVKSKCTNQEIEQKFYPKYNPMIKATCHACKKYIKFIEQTQATVDEVNKQEDDRLKVLFLLA